MLIDKYKGNWRAWTKLEWEKYFQNRGINKEIPLFSGTIFSKARDAAHFFNQFDIQ